MMSRGHKSILSVLVRVSTLAGIALASSAGFAQDAPEQVAPEKRTPSSPFVQACQDPKTRAAMIETGIFRREIPFTDLEGRSARKFLNRVADLIDVKIRMTEFVLDGFDECLSKDWKNPRCPDLHKFVDEDLVTLVRQARTHLAVAQTEHQLSTALRRGRTDINSQLDPLGTYRFTPWQPLNGDEIENAEAILREYRSEIDKEVQARIAREELPPPRPWVVHGKTEFFDHPETTRMRSQSMLVARLNHAESYREMIAEYPILQYMSSALPTRAELLGAVAKMRVMLLEEKQQLKRTVRYINRTEYRENGKMVQMTSLIPNALDVLQYRRIVELALLEEPQDCSVAAGLMIMRENRMLGNAIGVGLPILGASFVLGPFIAIPLGFVAGVAFTMESRADFKHAERQYLSQVKSIPMAGEVTEVEAAEGNYHFNLWTMPLAMMGSQVIARKLGVTLGAAIVGTKISKALPKGLRKQIPVSKLTEK